MNAVVTKTTLERNGLAGTGIAGCILGCCVEELPANYIDMWRAHIPGEETPPLPMIRVTTTAPELMGDKHDEDKLDAEHRTYIWFKNQEGWNAAFRLARRIIAGGRINAILVDGTSPIVAVRYASNHWDDDPLQTSAKLWIERVLAAAPVAVREALTGTCINEEVVRLTAVLTSAISVDEATMWRRWLETPTLKSQRWAARRQRIKELYAEGVAIANIAQVVATTKQHVEYTLGEIGGAA